VPRDPRPKLTAPGAPSAEVGHQRSVEVRRRTPQKRTLNRGAPPYHRRRYFPQ
jgi:hypothetical protein